MILNQLDMQIEKSEFRIYLTPYTERNENESETQA